MKSKTNGRNGHGRSSSERRSTLNTDSTAYPENRPSDGGVAAPAATAVSRRKEQLPGPPPILTLLPDRAARPHQLNKTQLLEVLLAFKKGDFSTRLPVDLEGVDGKIADAFNDVMELSERMAIELQRL